MSDTVRDSLIDEVDDTISYLNDEIYYNGSDEKSKDGHKVLSKWIEKNGNFLTYSSDGDSIHIKFLGFQLWNSNDDDRKLNEETDEYEALTPYLVKKIKELASVVSFLKDIKIYYREE